MKRFRNMIRPFHVFAVFGIFALIAALFFLLGNALSYFVYFPEFVQMTSWDYREYTMAYSFVFGGSAPFFAITEEGFHEGSENLIHPSFLALSAWITMVASLCASVVGLLLFKKRRASAVILLCCGFATMISGLAFFLVLKDAWSCLWNNEGASLDANTMSDGQLLLSHAKLGGGFIGCGVSGIASGLLFAFASILVLTEKTNSSSPH